MLGKFDVGDQPIFQFEWFSRDGALEDPTTLKVVPRNPAGTETVYVYGVAAEIVKTAVGIYEFTIPQFTASHVGAWSLRSNATGPTTASFEDTFEVRQTNYTTPLP